MEHDAALRRVLMQPKTRPERCPLFASWGFSASGGAVPDPGACTSRSGAWSDAPCLDRASPGTVLPPENLSEIHSSDGNESDASDE